MSFSIQLHTTKSKDLVPIVNSIPVHSLLNPVREAEVFATNFMSQLSQNPNVLILGLGFAYHVEEIERLLKLKHRSYSIMVIEGIPELARSCQSYKKISPNVKVLSCSNWSDLFEEASLINFLLCKPTIIMHPTLYKLNEPFYRNFLTRRANSCTESWSLPSEISSKDKSLLWINVIKEFKHAEF